MDEIIPGLWIGDLPSALNVESLKANNVRSILSAMRGRLTINKTFIQHQILLDDTEETDILVHFLPSISFIQAELDKGRGVLVHCHAGMSRSATIVAAYLMYSRNLDPTTALELVRKSRPNVCPNDGFLAQLEIFHQAAFKISRHDKSTRMFYMERAVEEVLNGDGSLPDTDMFAKFPRTPTDSVPATPGGPRRRIRCKMCRQELATREHMLDHGQLGPSTPAVNSPVTSRRPSMNDPPARTSRLPSTSQPRSRLGSIQWSQDSRPRRPSGLVESLSMSTLEGFSHDESRDGPATCPARADASADDNTPRPSLRPFAGLNRGLLDSLSMSALETEDDSDGETTDILDHPLSTDATTSHISREPTNHAPSTQFSTPGDLAAQLYANPKLAALRPPMIMTPLNQSSIGKSAIAISPPILMNPKCSGYFVEPMKWMEPFLQSGQLAGKIICPNKKCGAKLGNFDWAGVCCSCKEWVTPGFCIHRSKVDEIVG